MPSEPRKPASGDTRGWVDRPQSAIEWSSETIATYLYFGYLPDRSAPWRDRLPWSRFRRDRALAAMGRAELLEAGLDRFRSGFDAIDHVEKNVVPLSGGLDSRAILAELLQRLPPANILTVTVGIPGSFDYDIAPMVASAAGVEHIAIDLNTVRLEERDLRYVATVNGGPTWVFDAFFNRLMREGIGREVLYWSGYLGSRLSSDKHLPTAPPASWRAALRTFAESNRWTSTADLAPPGFDPTSSLPRRPLHPEAELDEYQQLDLSVRQESLVSPVNLPAGYRHRTPFRTQAWVNFALSLPPHEKQHQAAYRAMLQHAYPRLFALPTTNKLGLPLRPSRTELLSWNFARLGRGLHRRLSRHPRQWTRAINYIDFSAGLRERGDLRTIVERSLQRLGDQGVVPWLDTEVIWREHMSQQKDHAMALTLLASLDFHLWAAQNEPKR